MTVDINTLFSNKPLENREPYIILEAGANSTSKCNSRLKIRLLSEVRQKPPVAV